MITKIQPASNSTKKTTDYNERKMSADEGVYTDNEIVEYDKNMNTGHVIMTKNVPEGVSLNDEFNRLIWLNKRKTVGRKLERPSFHMSINPGANDRPLSEEEIVAFAEELMNELGYGDTPYRLYRHDDTDRTHYHISGIRIGQDGKKIRDAFENTRCEKITRKLASKYGYIYGLGEENNIIEDEEKNVTPDEQTDQNRNTEDTTQATASTKKDSKKDAKDKTDKKKKDYVPPFNKSNGPTTKQYIDCHNEAMRWHFTTFEQYMLLMKARFNIRAEIYNDNIHLTGLDNEGKPTFMQLTEKDMKVNMLEQVMETISKTDIKKYKFQKARLEKNIEEAAKAESLKDFKKNLNKAGIIMSISWSKEGKPFGITWLDRSTRIIWKGSETDKTLDWLLNKYEEKDWKLIQPTKKDKSSLTDKQKKNIENHKHIINNTRNDTFRNKNSKTQGSTEDASRNKGELDNNPGDIKL